MEELREKFIYTDTPIEICFKKHSPIEQYEIIRLIMSSPKRDVSICTHENTTSYIDDILKNLKVNFIQCFSVNTFLI